jgi:RimJ/RimL family protein N-acetyltransferase
MEISIHPMSQQDADDIASWRYEHPYQIYNLSRKDIPVLLDPENRYFAVKDEPSRRIGYCCFGGEARVPGGDYRDTEPLVIDVGVGMHPGMVGKGLGAAFVDAILHYAAGEFSPERFRVSVAAFNQRSQRTFLKLGFVETASFKRVTDGMRFVQLEREANWG